MIANIINELLFGFRYTYDNCDPLIRYVEDINAVCGHFLVCANTTFEILSNFAKNKLVLLGVGFPFLNKIPWIGYHTFEKHRERARYVNSSWAKSNNPSFSD